MIDPLILEPSVLPELWERLQGDADPGDEQCVKRYIYGSIPRLGVTWWIKQGSVDPFADNRWQVAEIIPEPEREYAES